MKTSRVTLVIMALFAVSASLWAQSAPSATDPAVPKEPGLYLYQDGHMTRVEGQVVSFARTGSLLSSAATFHIKSRKTNVQLLGRSAHVVAGPDPTFYFREATNNEAAGAGVADLVLLHMQVKGKRRQVEIGAMGAGRASAGVSIRSQVMFDRTEVGATVYRLNTSDLRLGQYCFYLFRGGELPAIMYPFGVE
jgi:hypothetical protein